MSAEPWGPRLAQLETRYEHVDKSLDDIRVALRALDAKIDGFNGRFDGVNSQFDGVNSRFDGVNSRIDNLRTAIDAKIQNLLYVVLGTWVTIILALFFHK